MAVSDSLDTGRRRFVYGANSLLVAVLAVVALGLALWIAGRFGGSLDLTSSGSNSLSERSRKLVRGLDTDITVTGLYTLAAKDVRKFAEKHHNRLRDLLDLYENAGGGRFKPRMVDPQQSPGEIAQLLARLKEKPKYRNESEPHQALLKRFPSLQKALAEALQDDGKTIEALAKADPILNQSRELFIVYQNLSEAAREARATDEDVTAALGGELPAYGKAVEAVRNMLTTARTALQVGQDWMGKAQSLSGISADAQSFFAAAGARYQPLLAQVDEMLKEGEALKKNVEIEDLYSALRGGNTVVIETSEEARVLRYDDVWSFRGGEAGADGDEREFSGERAISSAILQLTQKQKTGVIFVRVGGEPLLRPDMSRFNPMQQQMPQAPFGRINQVLLKENFETAEWDVAAESAPPRLEKTARTLLVVMPPEPQQPPNPMQPRPTGGITPEQKRLIVDAANGATGVVFLAGFSMAGGASPFGAPPYEFNDYLKSVWGVEARTSQAVIQFQAHPQQPGLWIPAQRPPVVLLPEAFDLATHPIVEPLRTLQYALLAACPLQITPPASQSADVKIESLINAANREGVWAVANYQRMESDSRGRQMGTKRYDDDTPGPFAVAVAGQDAKRRVVVFGSQLFIADMVLDAAQAVLTSAGIDRQVLFPGNPDLFVNALHWLTGDADRIAVGPASSDVPRLSKLTEASAGWVRVFLVGVWPALALALGGVVWFVRRR